MFHKKGYFNDLQMKYRLSMKNTNGKSKPQSSLASYKINSLMIYFKMVLKSKEAKETQWILSLENFLKLVQDYILKDTTKSYEHMLMELIVRVIEHSHRNTKSINIIKNKLPQNMHFQVDEDIETLIQWIPKKYFFKINLNMPSDVHLDITNILSRYYSPGENTLFFENFILDTVDKDEVNIDINSILKFNSFEKKVQTNNQSTFSLYDLYMLNKSKIPAFLDYQEFCSYVSSNLNSTTSSEIIFNDFLDTFGYDMWDTISSIIQNRYNIDYSTPLIQGNSKILLNKKIQSNYTPAMASQVTVQSEEEKILAKKLRKLERKGQNLDESEWISEKLVNKQYEPIFKMQKTQAPLNLPHVYERQMTKNATIHKSSSIKIPEEAIQKKTSLYSEITIPPLKNSFKDDFPLIEVKDLDITSQMVFSGIKKFNRIQSEVFPAAFHTNENLLICAPTGAGKTNIALLAMMNTILHHNIHLKNQGTEFKIIYVCPMKALATEMATSFGEKLSKIGVVVKELTGEMQLTKKQIAETHVIVSTPEKLDVITRKGAVDTEISSQMKLLVIDEVHLLNSSRGPVIESLVARVLKMVISSQSIIRIVALSATLPGYIDVAHFLKVNLETGLFFFDDRFRSVPLTNTFIGLNNTSENIDNLNKVCYQKLRTFVRNGHQVMVFVTARNQTYSAVNSFINHANEAGDMEFFNPQKTLRRFSVKDKYLEDLIKKGFGTHHAGMCRNDRLEVEDLFRCGHIKTIVCTATLAWGVNLPAHAVFIRGTSLYDPQQSKMVDLDVLDVLQIFGRAGRPQYDTSGHAVLITSSSKLSFYMNMLMSQTPIESKFLDRLPDNLNGEVVLGTVTNIKEAMEWLNTTYLFQRIKKNPLNYGLTINDIYSGQEYNFLQNRICEAAETLEKAEMIRYDINTRELRPTCYGRIASFLYITHSTLVLFMENLKRTMTDDDILFLLCNASEFQQIQVRNDELEELDRLRQEYAEMDTKLDVTSGQAQVKVMILIQTCLSKGYIKSSSLVSDGEYIMQNVVRLAMCLHELAVERNFGTLVSRTLIIAQMLDKRTWHFEHPLCQFKELNDKSINVLHKLHDIPIEEIRCMKDKDLSFYTKNHSLSKKILHYAKCFPQVTFELIVKPITEGIIRIKLEITPDFKWDNLIHGNVQHFISFIEDPMYDGIYHLEKFVITEKAYRLQEPVQLTFTVPLLKPHSEEYYVKVCNAHFLHSEVREVIQFSNITLLPNASIETKFINVKPLPKSALRNPPYESIYSFNHFNGIQSQVFFCCYNTDDNILLGAPTGSGKTVVAELCMLRLFSKFPTKKVVYIAPMKALVREKMKDWTVKFKKINKIVTEITGDVTPNSEFVNNANIIITTPEKWDGMSRNWHRKDFVKSVGLIIIDEIHLLAEERGPVLEVIVSRMNYINTFNKGNVRIIGLSTAMANAGDLANWLNVKDGLFNFSSSVRPVPLEIHIQGFTGRNYCPRMAAMNKPAYQAICQYAPKSPSLIFVASRKQTRITAHELVKFVVLNNELWRTCSEEEINLYRDKVIDNDLSYVLQFGIGIHHAGLQENDRIIVEELFVNQKIQVLVATATLAWGVNFPAHLVIVKGTEYYDGATKRYVDMPVTDVLQMLGRAGRPQYDTHGVACVFVEESKKAFYRKFLFESFPVESSLLQVLPDHINAEISNGTIVVKEQLIDFICSTFFFRRLLVNPSYYQKQEMDISTFLSELADSVAETLSNANCITVAQVSPTEFTYESTVLGHIAAKYYLSYKSVFFFNSVLSDNLSFYNLLLIISQSEEYLTFPVRHNEDKINRELMKDLNIEIDVGPESPAAKVYILIYCYMNGIVFPNQEYIMDLKSVFDQIIRILQGMIELSVTKNLEVCCQKLINLSQMLIQGLPLNSNSLLMLPHMDANSLDLITQNVQELPSLKDLPLTFPCFKLLILSKKDLYKQIFKAFQDKHVKEITQTSNHIPLLLMSLTLKNQDTGNYIDLIMDKSKQYFSVELQRNTNFMLTVELKRQGGPLRVYSKSFNKQKEEMWFLLVRNEEGTQDFQRLSFKNRKTYQIQLRTPDNKGKFDYTVLIFSDSYLGLDQKVTLMVSAV